MKKLLVGIDFSKETMNFCCMHGCAGKIVLEGVVENSISGCKEMVRKLRGIFKDAKVCDFLFCGENTGYYSLAVADYLHSKRYFIWLESPLQVKLSSGMRRGKTDVIDARMIAEYAFRHQDKAREYNPLSPSIIELKEWLMVHDSLTHAKVDMQNLLGSMKVKPCTLRKALEDIKKRLKETDKKIRELLSQEEEFRENAALAMSVPGLSFISTAAILIDTQNFTRFSDPRKYANHVGCVPHPHESGTSIYKKPHVCKTSNRYINSLLTQGAVSLMTHNAQMKEYANKKKKEGKNTGCIINNIRNKTIHRLFAVIKQQNYFDEDYEWGNRKKKSQENYS